VYDDRPGSAKDVRDAEGQKNSLGVRDPIRESDHRPGPRRRVPLALRCLQDADVLREWASSHPTRGPEGAGWTLPGKGHSPARGASWGSRESGRK